MGSSESGKGLQVRGLLILALCMVFTLFVFWVARVIQTVSVVWTSVVAICPPLATSSSSTLMRIQEPRGTQRTCACDSKSCDATRDSLHRRLISKKG